MSSTTLFADVEKPVRDWLRDQALSGVSDRVYVGLPNDATFPALEVALVDGGVQPGEAPIADVLFSFSVWAGDVSQRTTVAAVAWALASLLQSTTHADLTGGLTLLGARVLVGPVPRFDPDGTPRYLLDAALTVRVSA